MPDLDLPPSATITCRHGMLFSSARVIVRVRFNGWGVSEQGCLTRRYGECQRSKGSPEVWQRAQRRTHATVINDADW